MKGQTNASGKSSVVQVNTDPGLVVTASNGTTTKTATASSSGVALFNNLLGGEWTFSLATGHTKTVFLEHILTIFDLYPMTIWGADIDIATSNPWDRVSYPTDVENAGYTPASGTSINGWAGSELISDIAPVRISNGAKTYLNKRNPAETVDGAASNIATAGNDAMVEFPLKWLSITSDGTTIRIRFSDRQADSTYQCYAHRLGGVQQSAFYYGMFLATVSSNKVYSQAGTSPTVSKSITDFISYAKARGTGYDIATFYQTMYLEALAIVLFKTTDIQGSSNNAHGLAYGYAGGSSSSSKANNTILAYTNDYGMYGSTTAKTTRMSFLWVNDFYGNCYAWIGGAKTNSTRKLLTIVDGYSSVTESDFEKTIDIGVTADISGYYTGVHATTDSGLMPNKAGGSETTYWADYCVVYASSFPYFGGRWNGGGSAGFYWGFYYSATNTDTYVSSRLSYRAGIA